jgi:hypothetical protein
MPETAKILNFPSGQQGANVLSWAVSGYSPSVAISDETFFDDWHPMGQLQALISNLEAKEAEMASEGEVRTEAIAAAEARTDTKIAKLEGKLDLVLAKLETVNENTIAGRQEVSAVRQEIKHSERAVKANAWVIGFGLLGVIIALVIGLPTIFDLGTKQRDTISKEVQEQLQKRQPDVQEKKQP